VTATHGSRHFTSDLRLYVRSSVQVRRSACVLHKCSRRKFFRVCLARGVACCIILSLQRDEGKFCSPFALTFSPSRSLFFSTFVTVRMQVRSADIFSLRQLGYSKDRRIHFHRSFGLLVPDRHTNVDYKHGVRIKSFP